MRVCLLVLALTAAAAAQDNKPKLSLPDHSKCERRSKHEFFEDFRNGRRVRHNYLKSWQDGAREETWFHARNYCRERCMDLVSMETDNENNFIKNMVQGSGREKVYTVGRMCNFGDDCKRQDLQPIKVNGWFWAGVQTKIPATDRDNRWSSFNRCNGQRQPDQCSSRADEACMVMGRDGGWHDETCGQQFHFICEDSDELLNFARFNGARV